MTFCHKNRHAPFAMELRVPVNIKMTNLLQICRVCVMETSMDKLVDVVEAADYKLNNDIYDFFKIRIRKKDTFSKMMCLLCIQKIEEMRAERAGANRSQVVQAFLFSKAENANIIQSVPAVSTRRYNSTEIDRRRNIYVRRSCIADCCKPTTSQTKSLRSQNACPICVLLTNRPPLRPDIKSKLCTKHMKVFTCPITNCELIFTNINMFFGHYRKHLNLDKSTYLCRQCYGVFRDTRNSENSKHQHSTILTTCCSKRFHLMSELVLHKLSKHNMKIISPGMNFNGKVVSKNDVSTNQSSVNEELETNTLFRGKLFTCTVPGCNLVFSNKKNNCDHYRQHANISIEFSTCGICLMNHRLVDGLRGRCDHKNKCIKCTPCNIEFDALYELAKHRLDFHMAIVLCGENEIPGCPICGKAFEPGFNPFDHYHQCFAKNLKIGQSTVPMAINNSNETSVAPKVNHGSLKCKDCSQHFSSANDYVTHSKKLHHNTYELKKTGIRLCPLCDLNYDVSRFTNHIAKCTDSMKVGDVALNKYGCAVCKNIYSNYTPSKFRCHYMFCKSFTSFTDVHGERYYNCMNCTFLCNDYSMAEAHANSYCVYLQLKTRFAMRPNEKEEVEERKQLEEKYSKVNNSWPKVNQSPPAKSPGCFVPTQDTQLDSHSEFYCNSLRRGQLGCYAFFCIYCNNAFFNEYIFAEHVNADGVKCRSNKTWYCKKCVTDFESENDFIAHDINNDQLPAVPDAIPIDSVDHITNESTGTLQQIKNELFNYDKSTDVTFNEHNSFMDYDENYFENDNTQHKEPTLAVSNEMINMLPQEPSYEPDYRLIPSTSYQHREMNLDYEAQSDNGMEYSIDEEKPNINVIHQNFKTNHSSDSDDYY